MTLSSAFAAVANRLPQKVALITDRNQLSFQDLYRLAHLMDMELRTRGVQPGQTIVVATRRTEFILALALVMSLRSLTMAFTDAATAQAAGLQFDRLVTTDRTDLVGPDRQIGIEPGWFEALSSLRLPDWSNAGGEGTFVTQSSGTTGRPKLIRAPEAMRLAQARDELFFGPENAARRRFLTTLAPSTGYGLNSNLAVLLAGGSVVSLVEHQDRLLQHIDLHRVDTLAISPALVERMLGLPKPEQYLTGVRDVRFLGAMASPALLSAIAKICPGRIHIGYGSTELGRIFAGLYDPARPMAAGHVGRLMRDDLEVVFCDDALAPIPGAVEGIVGFRPKSGTFARAYHSSSDTAPEAGFINGIFYPGDIMRRDGDDYFAIGRTKSIVNFGGNKVALEAVAEVLATAFPGGSFVPMVTLDAMGLERLAVAYRADTEIVPAAMETALRQRFKGLTVSRTRRLDAFPLTSTGKVDLQALKMFWLEN
jgi:non-ribosomal peptide synthetase component E (peptide arylation enzyme)